MSHLAHVSESDGKLVMSVLPAQSSMENSALGKLANSTLPNQTGINLDNRKIMWWKMDRKLSQESHIKIYLEAVS